MSKMSQYFPGFSLEDQNVFATLSGDFNPVHLDRLYARRSIWGDVVVHGINQVLFLLNHFFSDKKGCFALTEIKTEFIKPLQVNSEFQLIIIEKEQVVAELVSTEGVRYTKFDFSYKACDFPFEEHKGCHFDRESPDLCNLENIEGFSCQTNLRINKKLLRDVYVHLFSKLPLSQVALLTATTRVVGMKCPGKNSIFSELHLRFGSHVKQIENAVFEVDSVHRVFKLVQINISCEGISGSLKTFLRPEPYRQATIEVLKEQVELNQFRGEKALVVGGSRGIGEVAVKLLAIGGADVTFTYNSGEKEADEVVECLRATGYKVKAIYLNVLNENLILDDVYSTLYYFPSPFIFSGIKDRFSLDNFIVFAHFYIHSFVKLVQHLNSGKLKKVFYPSSVAVDELVNGMWEYSSAKAAAEHICDLMEKRYPELVIYKPRFPRVTTDQTLTLMPVKSVAPEVALKDFFSEFQALER